MKGILLFLLCFLVSLSSFGQNSDWVGISGAEDGSFEIYIHEDIKQPYGKLGPYRVWVMYCFNSPNIRDEYNTEASEWLVLYELNNDLSEWRYLEQIEYNELHKVIDSTELSGKWEYIVPDSVVELIAKYVMYVLSE